LIDKVNDKAFPVNAPLARLIAAKTPYFLTSIICNLSGKPYKCYRLTLLCLSSVCKA